MERYYDLHVGSFLAKQLEVNQINAISNGLILELSKVKDENNCTDTSLCSWILKLSGTPHDVSLQGEKAIMSSLARLQERYKALLKSRHMSTGQQMLTAFLETSYTLPKLEHATPSTTSYTTPHRSTSRHQPGSDSSDNCESEETQRQSQKVVAMEKQITTAHDKLGNVKKKLHRRETTRPDLLLP